MIENDDGKEQLIGEVTQGENVGEMALITGENRTANVYALRDCELVKLSKSIFERLIKQHPQIMMAITQNIIIVCKNVSIRRASTRLQSM
jgi:CRP-like cAMP-binding protein